MFYSLINMVAELVQNKIQCIEILSVSTKVVQTQAFPTHIQHNIFKVKPESHTVTVKVVLTSSLS